jgi:hypothetical protein
VSVWRIQKKAQGAASPKDAPDGNRILRIAANSPVAPPRKTGGAGSAALRPAGQRSTLDSLTFIL